MGWKVTIPIKPRSTWLKILWGEWDPNNGIVKSVNYLWTWANTLLPEIAINVINYSGMSEGSIFGLNEKYQHPKSSLKRAKWDPSPTRIAWQGLLWLTASCLSVCQSNLISILKMIRATWKTLVWNIRRLSDDPILNGPVCMTRTRYGSSNNSCGS